MTAPIVSVAGGVGGIRAQIEDLLIAAAVIGGAADDVEAETWIVRQRAADALDLFGPDPAGAVRAREAIWCASDAPLGAAGLARICDELAQLLRRAAANYLSADAFGKSIFSELPHFVAATGHGIGRFDVDLVERRPVDAVQSIVSTDPQLASAFLSVPPFEWLLTGNYAALAPDGHPVVRSLGDDPQATRPPRSLADILSGLGRRNDGHAGEIDVRILTGVDGSGQPYRKVIVDIPGTKQLVPVPGPDLDVVDEGTNARAIAGQHDDVRERRHRRHAQGRGATGRRRDGRRAQPRRHGRRQPGAGRRERKRVPRLARRDDRSTHRNRPEVVAVLGPGAGDREPVRRGSGTRRLGQPRSTQRHDRHHRLDHDSIAANHDIAGSYVPGARSSRRQLGPSITNFLDGIDGFVNANDVTTHTYAVTRGF